MLLNFVLQTGEQQQPVSVHIEHLVIAGWAGRDMAAVEHHIEELAALGVPRPSSVPLYYRVAAQQLTQAEAVQCVGSHTSGEAEAFVFAHQGQWLVSVMSDHTDRSLEAASVALSKQVCPKPVARTAWRWCDVQDHWDQLRLRARIMENGLLTLYQDGPLASLRSPHDLVAAYMNGTPLPDGTGMSCGTVPAIGGIRPSSVFEMELHDPVRGCSLMHRYCIHELPQVA